MDILAKFAFFGNIVAFTPARTEDAGEELMLCDAVGGSCCVGEEDERRETKLPPPLEEEHAGSTVRPRRSSCLTTKLRRRPLLHVQLPEFPVAVLLMLRETRGRDEVKG
nr:hypothetical protein Iba_chr01aCG16400 [Ipomoea batatas]